MSIRYTNDDILWAKQQSNQSILYPSNYWNDKTGQITVSNPNIPYYTNIIENFQNINVEELLTPNTASLVIDNSVLEIVNSSQSTYGGKIILPDSTLNVLTQLNMNGKNYANEIEIDVSDLNVLPVLNDNIQPITSNGVYEIADTDNNPEDLEIEKVDNRRSITKLNLIKKNDLDLDRDIIMTTKDDAKPIQIGQFTVDVKPNLQGVRVVHNEEIVNRDRPLPITPSSGYDGLSMVQVDQIKLVPGTTNSLGPIDTITTNGTHIISRPVGSGALGFLGDVKVEVNVEGENIPTLESVNYTSNVNGVVTIEPPQGSDGISSVLLTTAVQPKLTSVSRKFTSNDTYTIRLDDSTYDGISSVNVEVDVPQYREMILTQYAYPSTLAPDGYYEQEFKYMSHGPMETRFTTVNLINGNIYCYVHYPSEQIRKYQVLFLYNNDENNHEISTDVMNNLGFSTITPDLNPYAGEIYWQNESSINTSNLIKLLLQNNASYIEFKLTQHPGYSWLYCYCIQLNADNITIEKRNE